MHPYPHYHSSLLTLLPRSPRRNWNLPSWKHVDFSSSQPLPPSPLRHPNCSSQPRAVPSPFLRRRRPAVCLDLASICLPLCASSHSRGFAAGGTTLVKPRCVSSGAKNGALDDSYYWGGLRGRNGQVLVVGEPGRGGELGLLVVFDRGRANSVGDSIYSGRDGDLDSFSSAQLFLYVLSSDCSLRCWS